MLRMWGANIFIEVNSLLELEGRCLEESVEAR